jgi:HK97 family phage prohead protease
LTTLTSLKKAFEREKLGDINKLQAAAIRGYQNETEIYKSMADEALQKIENLPLQKGARAGLPGAAMSYAEDETQAQLTSAHDEFPPDELPTQEEVAAREHLDGIGPVREAQATRSARLTNGAKREEDDDEEAVKAMRAAVFGIVSKHFLPYYPSGVIEFQKEFDEMLRQVAPIDPIHKSFGVSYPLTDNVGRISLEKAADGYTYVSGYVSDGSLDRDGDKMAPSALKQMCEAINGGMALFGDHNHGYADTLGAFVPGSAKIDNKGLFAEARLESAETNPNVKSLLSKLEAGIPLGFSIGGDLDGSTRVKEYDEKTGSTRSVRRIDGVKLYEVSVVGLPSNPNARITGVR